MCVSWDVSVFYFGPIFSERVWSHVDKQPISNLFEVCLTSKCPEQVVKRDKFKTFARKSFFSSVH